MSLKNLSQWIPLGNVPELSAEDLNQKLGNDELQIVDVRTPQEWNVSRIANAINLPITQFSAANIEALNLDKNKTTITICLSAHRSIPAVRQLQSMGFTHCMQLKGGMLSWWKKDFATMSKRKVD